jgi:hypothetical protein
MIEATLSVSVGAVMSRGASDAARYVGRRSEEATRRLRNSAFLGLRSVLEELVAVAEECALPNWDGHGAAPITEAVLREAYRVLESTPMGFPSASLGAEPDGQITLEWHMSPRRTLSVSVSAEGELHYAAILGASKVYGTEPFLGDFPKAILDLIRRVFT